MTYRNVIRAVSLGASGCCPNPYGLSPVFRRLSSQGAAMVDSLLECSDLRPAQVDHLPDQDHDAI